MLRNILKISPSAIKQLKLIKDSHQSSALKFYIKGGGCNGFNYQIEPTNEKADKLDEIVKVEDLEIHVCGKSLMYILGTEIDWNVDIMGSTFKFNNPNANSNCGCGSSFGI
jgi:iron-sulfur cluster assembly protein